MAERFKRLYKLASEFVCTDAPVTIEDGALLQDTVTGKLLVQLKLKNISDKNIKAVKVGLKTFDIEGLELAGIESFSYLDLNIMPNNSFGSKNPIMINDVTTRSYKPYVTTVVFNDDTVWNSSADEWFQYRERKELKEELDSNLRQEYISELSSGYNGNVFMYVPVKEKGYYRCACGILNKIDNEKCASCKTEKTKIFEKYNIEQLTEAFNKKEAARKVKEETERLEAERKAEERRIAARKRKMAFAIGTPIVAACITFVIVLITVIIPKQKFHEAMNLLDSGDYDSAYALLHEIGKDEEILSNKYDRAIKLIDSGDYEPAYMLLNGLEYKDSNEKLDSIKPQYQQIILRKADVGDIVYFGAYEQDNNTSNGKEDVEWIVLAKENEKALVISKYALDCQRYNTSRAGVIWENCSLRKWMNETFLNKAFSAEEQAQISSANVSADKNPEYSTNPGNSTNDKVFLLSIAEAKKYFTTDESLKCTPTTYAETQGVWTSDSYKTASGKATCGWWLRSPGDGQSSAAIVNYVGSVGYGGMYVNRDRVAVRPAMWINLD